MKFSLKGLAVAAAVLWAGALLFVGAANLVDTSYGVHFLQLMASIYPGYDALPSVPQLMILVLYGLVDGAVCGLLFAWIYNLVAVPRILQ